MDDAALSRFRGLYEFGLDPFQEKACASILGGRGVLVAAPTGSGKTVVGEFAVHLAIERSTKCFYTTPIKALSNQKYNDLVERYGARAGRAADRGQLDQRRGPGGRDDHRGPAQHALRRVAHPHRTGVRRDGRGPLPGRPGARTGVGGGHHQPPRARQRGRAVGDRQQRRGVRRLVGRGARRHRHRGRGAPAGAAVAARASPTGPCTTCSSTSGAGRSTPSWCAWPATTSASTRPGGIIAAVGAGSAGPTDRPRAGRSAGVDGRARCRAPSVPTSSGPCSARTCCPASTSSSAVRAARRRSSSACTRGCS